MNKLQNRSVGSRTGLSPRELRRLTQYTALLLPLTLGVALPYILCGMYFPGTGGLLLRTLLLAGYSGGFFLLAHRLRSLLRGKTPGTLLREPNCLTFLLYFLLLPVFWFFTLQELLAVVGLLR